MPDSPCTIPRVPHTPRGILAIALALALGAACAPVLLGAGAGLALGALLGAGGVAALALGAKRTADGFAQEVTVRVDELKELLEIQRRTEAKLRADLRVAEAGLDAASEARRRAESAERNKTTVLSTLSRELRTPLSNILGLTGILLDTQLSEGQKSYARKVHIASETGIGLLDDVLDLCRLEVGELCLEQREFEPAYCVESAVEAAKGAAADRELSVELDVDPSIPTWVVGDRARLRQVLMALCGRAAEHSPTGRVRVGVGLAPASRSGENLAGLSFTIEPQRDPAGDAPEGALVSSPASVGLSLAEGLVEHMGGSLGTESEVGAYAFTLTFALGSQAGTAAATKDERELAGLRMLLISDDRNCVSVADATGARLGMRVDSAPSGTEGVALLRECSAEDVTFDVIVLDGDLPDVSGRDLIGILRDAPEARDAGCILLRGTECEERPDQLVRLGFDAWVKKPLSATRLSTAILHVAAEPAERAQEPEALVDRAEGPCIGAAVLLAEDNLVNQKVMTLMLERLGCTVATVRTGMQAIEAVMERDFDIVLMDCRMPELDGVEATRAIRRLSDPVRSQLPIVALTAAEREEDRRACADAGMNAYLTKPARASRLVQVLATWVGRAGPEPSERAMQPSPTPIDPEVLASLKELGGDDPSIFVELVDLFLMDTPPRLQQLYAAQEEGDAAGVVASAHALKSSCGNLGALGLSDLCRDIESRGRAGDVDSVASLVAACRDEFDRVEQALRREIA